MPDIEIIERRISSFIESLDNLKRHKKVFLKESEVRSQNVGGGLEKDFRVTNSH
jgi:hypothetical protein